MKAFTFLAYTDDGRRKTGTILAQDTAEASQKLRADGLHPENISAQSEAGSALRAGRVRKLDADMQAIFARQVAVLLAADLPVDDVMDVIRSAGSSRAMEQVALRVRTLLMDGLPLSDALDRGASGFPAYVISAVRAGEASGEIATVFETIASHLEERRTDKAALATAIIYPAFVAAVSFLVCAVLMTTVAPEIARMFEASGQPLPALTRTMLGIADWLSAYGLWLLAALAALSIGLTLLLRRPAPRRVVQDGLLRLPVIGRLIRLEAAAQYLRTLALVISSKQPVIEGVENATAVLTIAQFRAQSDAATQAIRAGTSLSGALAHTTFIPAVARQLVEAGEKSAKLAKMADRAAALMENWLANDRKRIAAILDPMLMMVVGGFVLVVVLSVLLPIFDLQGTISP